MYTTHRPIHVSSAQIDRALNQYLEFEAMLLNDKKAKHYKVGLHTLIGIDMQGLYTIQRGSLHQVGEKNVLTGETLWSVEFVLGRKTMIERGSVCGSPNAENMLSVHDMLLGRMEDIARDVKNGKVSSVVVNPETRTLTGDGWEARVGEKGTFILSNLEEGDFFFDHLTTAGNVVTR